MALLPTWFAIQATEKAHHTWLELEELRSGEAAGYSTKVWNPYTPERLEAARRDGKIVIIDFTAEWCLNCKTLEATVLQTPDVVAAFDRDEVVPMKIDLTGENPDGKAKLEEAKRLTIPLLVVYGRQGAEIWKSDAYTPSQVLGAIDEADLSFGREGTRVAEVR